jgi:MoxR-like ATPase
VDRGDIHELLTLGISPRSYQHLLALSRVNAFLNGRSYVAPEDVKEIAVDAMRHRVARSVRAQAEGIEADYLLGELLRAVPIP